ncbi:MAG: UDP-3-O-acyl-N-acetylglucosamine deacetylase [Xanthobacteraceae bacterium]
MYKIFICYRRQDSAGYAGRVYDRLEREFGNDLLFIDVASMPLGVSFVKILRDEVAKCDVLLAVIGQQWINATDTNGNRLLDDPNDWVRIEIRAALDRDIPVIPILLEGTEIPKTHQLPPDIQELSLRNGLNVHHSSFHADMDRLIRGLKSLSRGASSHPTREPHTTPASKVATIEAHVARTIPTHQTTLRDDVSLVGIGVHTGSPATLKICPAEENSGYIFHRVGLVPPQPEFTATLETLHATEFASVLSPVSGVPSVSSAEYVLSALSGLGIDNAWIEVDGPEIPIFDGSAGPIVEAIEAAGITNLTAPRRYIKVVKPIRVRQGDAYGELLPDNHTIFEATTYFEHPLLGAQHFQVTLDSESYRHEVARARAFGFMRDIARLWSAGYALGASFENTVVFAESRILNPEGLRYPNECTRHKVLGAIGDFALAGAPLLGRYKNYLGGHKLNFEVLSELFKDRSAFQRIWME